MAENEPEFFPLYVRPALSPVVILGWIWALIAAIVVYTWLVVQINDDYYEGVSDSRCHIKHKYIKNENPRLGGEWVEVERHLEILTDERDDVHNWREVASDCKE
jgi:hypothetical protein